MGDPYCSGCHEYHTPCLRGWSRWDPFDKSVNVRDDFVVQRVDPYDTPHEVPPDMAAAGVAPLTVDGGCVAPLTVGPTLNVHEIIAKAIEHMPPIEPVVVPSFADVENPKHHQGTKKPQLQLVPPAAEIAMAKALTEGARKYGPYNWREKKIRTMDYLGAAKRHILAMIDGEDVDPESEDGKTHLDGVLGTLAVLADAVALGNIIDDRPPKGPAPGMLRAPGFVLTEDAADIATIAARKNEESVPFVLPTVQFEIGAPVCLKGNGYRGHIVSKYDGHRLHPDMPAWNVRWPLLESWEYQDNLKLLP